jgi:hypothetical protein
MNGENGQPYLAALLKTHGGAQGQRGNIAAMEEITHCRPHVQQSRGNPYPPVTEWLQTDLHSR